MPSISTVNIWQGGPKTIEVTLKVTADGDWTKESGVTIGAAEGWWEMDGAVAMFFYWQAPPDHFHTREKIHFMNLSGIRPKNAKVGDKGLAFILEGRVGGFPTDSAGNWDILAVSHGEKSSVGTEEDVRRMQFVR
jgi:hypothetical protein